MHILILVENLPVPPDYRVWRIACTLRDAGHRVSVISPATRAWPAGEFDIDGIAVLRHSLPFEARALWSYPLEYALALFHELRLSLQVFRRARFQVIHLCNPPDLLWLVALVWRAFGVRVVYDHHDLCPELILAKSHCTAPQQLPWLRRMIYRLTLALERRSHRMADIVLATNESYARIARERHGIPAARVVIVKTAPRADELPAEPAPCGASVDVPRIAYVGVMARQDGVDGLLRAAHCLRNELRRVFQLVLIGDGPERAALERQARELGLDDCVTFRGFLPRAALMGELMQCVMGVTPDPSCPMNDASTMLKVLDYMACGLPQVAYDLPEHRVSAGEAALYAAPGDEHGFATLMAHLLDHPALRLELGRLAFARIRALVWEEHGAPALLRAYQQCSEPRGLTRRA